MEKLVTVEVPAYRGLRDLVMEGLTEINVLIGPTNAGKSSLLEAVWLASAPDDLPASLDPIFSARGVAGATSLRTLFPNMDPATPIDIRLQLVQDGDRETGTISIGPPTSRMRDARYVELLNQDGWKSGEYEVLEARASRRSISQEGEPDKRPPGSFVLEFAVRNRDAVTHVGVMQSGQPFSLIKHRYHFLPGQLSVPSVFDNAYSTAYLANALNHVVEALAMLYPGLQDIRPVKVEDDRWITFVRLQQNALPLFAMGDGFRAAFIILAYATRGGLLLLDSPEVFQHRKGLEALARGLVEAVSRWRSQVLLATQSLELLDLLLQEGSEKQVDLRVYRLGLSQGRTVIYPPLSLEKARESREIIGADLRG